MRDKWQALLDRFTALSTRERLLVLLAVFAVAYQLADLVVLSRDIFRVDPDQILDTRVEMTVFDGQIVYQAPA